MRPCYYQKMIAVLRHLPTRAENVTAVKMLVILLVHAALPAIGFAASAQASGRSAYLLPWQIIAEKVREGARFCESKCSPDHDKPPNLSDINPSVHPNCGYAYQPDVTITVPSPVGTPANAPLQEINISLAKWDNNSWGQIGQALAVVEPNEIRVVDGIREPGFFRLRFALQGEDGRRQDFECYVIVIGKWEKDVLAFCYEMKEQLELNRDPNLIYSSVAIAHVERVLYIISSADFLSGEILESLAHAVKSKAVFDKGLCPELVMNAANRIRLKRFEGAKLAEFTVYLPKDYDRSRKWPVLLVPGGGVGRIANVGLIANLVTVMWGFPGHIKEFEWKDWESLLGFLRNKVNLDEDRIYLDAFCGFGIGAMAIALHYPDQFAECNTAAGNSYRHLAGNALNLPLFHALHGERAELFPYGRFVLKCFKYYGCRRFNTGRTRLTAVREKSPQRVLYTVDSLDNPRAYWACIDGREDENFPATIDCCVWGQTVLVRTENVAAYSLDLAKAPIDTDREVEIIENGESLGRSIRDAFTRKPQAYTGATYIKNEYLHGPVWDAFRDPYVVVWGTGGTDKKFSEVGKELAKSLANGVPCFGDTDMPEELVSSRNLILVGTAESNLWLSKIAKDLPVQIQQGRIVANGKRYDAPDTGFVLIYPNPSNPHKYVVVFSGVSSPALAGTAKAYSQMKAMMQTSDSIQPSDVGIFEVTEKGQIKWHIMEKFDTVWGWHKQWDQGLAVTKKPHPKWQWRQWVARALREQLGADMVICMDPFKFSDSLPTGEITYRDLFNTFRNGWIVKIKVAGKPLKELLLAPSSDDSRPRATVPIIDGVTALKSAEDARGKALTIAELKNDLTYTAAMPYQFINGELLGVGLAEYEIVKEDYLVRLLRDYLCSNKDSDLDARLDGLKFNVLW